MNKIALKCLYLTDLYGTLRFSWYKDSNLASLVRDATVRMFSMASVAICEDTPHEGYRQKSNRALLPVSE